MSFSMKIVGGAWSRDLNYNTMVSQRGVVNLYHSDAQRDAYARRGNMMRIHGVDAELLDEAGIRKQRAPSWTLTMPVSPHFAAGLLQKKPRRHGAA